MSFGQGVVNSIIRIFRIILQLKIQGLVNFKLSFRIKLFLKNCRKFIKFNQKRSPLASKPFLIQFTDDIL
jgi:hypothetical protein